MPGTPDDALNETIRFTYDATGNRTEYTDSLVTTGIVFWLKYTYDAHGQPIAVMQFDDKGIDNTWKTNDDRYVYDYTGDGIADGHYSELTYDPQGRQARSIYKWYGPDMKPMTADDVIESWSESQYDVAGNLTRRTSHNAPGGNGTWLDSDDPVSGYTEYKFEAGGFASYNYTAAGVCQSHQIERLNANKQTSVQYVFFDAGPDTIPCNGDDLITYAPSRYIYDSYGNRVDSKEYVAGQDTIWETPDDRWYSDYDYNVVK
jgi:YD repeat-containing protein